MQANEKINAYLLLATIYAPELVTLDCNFTLVLRGLNIELEINNLHAQILATIPLKNSTLCKLQVLVEYIYPQNGFPEMSKSVTQRVIIQSHLKRMLDS